MLFLRVVPPFSAARAKLAASEHLVATDGLGVARVLDLEPGRGRSSTWYVPRMRLRLRAGPRPQRVDAELAPRELDHNWGQRRRRWRPESFRPRLRVALVTGDGDA